MNRELQNTLKHDEQQQLDRLVDGELSAEEQRALLLRLESLPDGWRQCALAFLEAQAWGSELRGCDESPVATMPTELPAVERSGDPPPGSDRFGPLGPWGAVLGMAASFLLAFFLGQAWEQGWFGEGMPPSGFPGPGQIANSSPGSELGQPDAPVANGPYDSPALQTMTVAFPAADGNQNLQVDVPFFAGPGFDEEWLRSQPSALSPQLLQQLRRSGHVVDQDRHLLPVELEGGQRAVLPVDQVKVRFVGNKAFQ